MEETFEWARRLVGGTWRRVKAPLYRNAFLIMLSSVIGQGLGFFFWLVVARFYERADVGYAVALFQTLSFLATLASLGLGIGLIRYLPEEEDKPPLVNTAATITGGGALLLAAVFLGTVSLVVPNLSFVLSDPTGRYLYPPAILVTTVAIALPYVYDQTSFAMRRADVLTWRTLIVAVAKLPLVAAFALVPLTAGRIGVFLSLALAFVAGTAVEAFVLLPRVLPGFRPRLNLAVARIRPMVRFALGNYSANVVGGAGVLLLPILILNLLGPASAEQVAYYYIASIVAGLLSIIPGAIFTSFYAEASQRNARRHVDERRAIALSIALLLPGIAALWLLSKEMLTWFGDPAYAAGAVGALRILVFGSIPAFLNNILGTRIRIRKQSAPLLVGALITTSVTLGLGVVLLRSNGINGLAIATVLGGVAVLPYYYTVARRSFKEDTDGPAAQRPT